MKTFALLAAAAMAVSTANAAECVITDPAFVANFSDLISDVFTCSGDTGYSIVPPTTYPTTQQSADICTKCSKLVAAAKTKTIPTCTFKIDGVDTPLNVFFEKFVGACGTSSGSSTGSSAGSKTTVAVGTTPAPATTSKSSGSGSKASSATVKTPTPTTPTPTTATPKSAGVVATVSAAVVAVASVAAYAL